MPIVTFEQYVEPRNDAEAIADGWIEIGDTGVYENPKNKHEWISFYEHYCGLQGFGYGWDDVCPKCDAHYRAQQIRKAEGRD
jgi:hypothetical protein